MIFKKQIALPGVRLRGLTRDQAIDDLVDQSGVFIPNLRYGQQFAHLIPIKGGKEGAKVHVLLAWGFPYVLKVIRGQDLKKGNIQTLSYVEDEILPGIDIAIAASAQIPTRILPTRLYDTLRIPLAVIHPLSVQDLLSTSPYATQVGDCIEVSHAIIQERATPLDVLFRRIQQEYERGHLSEDDYVRLHLELMHEMFNAAEALWSVDVQMLNMTVYNMMVRGRTVCFGDFDSFRWFSDLNVMTYSDEELDMWGGERLGGDKDICHLDYFTALMGPFKAHPGLLRIYQQVADRVFSQRMMIHYQRHRIADPTLPRLIIEPALSQAEPPAAPVKELAAPAPSRRRVRLNRQFLGIDPGYRKARRLGLVVGPEFVQQLDDPDSVEYQLLSETSLPYFVVETWDRLASMGKITLDGHEIAQTFNEILWEKLPEPFHIQGFGVVPTGQDASAPDFRLVLRRSKIHPGVPIIGISTQPDLERLFALRGVTFLDELLIPENLARQVVSIVYREAAKGTGLLNVLVVHENPAIRQNVEQALRRQTAVSDIRVVPAGDVYEALEMIRERGPFHAVIVKDDTRPGPQGHTLIDLIRGGLTAADTNRLRPQIAREARMVAKLVPDASLEGLLRSPLATRFAPETLWKTWLKIQPRDASVLGEITRSTGYITHGRLDGHALDVVIKFHRTPDTDAHENWVQQFRQMALEMEMLDELHGMVPGLVPFNHGPVVVPSIRHFAFATERVAGYDPDSLFQNEGTDPLITPHEIISLFAKVDYAGLAEIEQKLLDSRLWKKGKRFKLLVLNRDQTVHGIPRKAGDIVIVEFLGYRPNDDTTHGWEWSMAGEIQAAKARAHVMKARKIAGRAHIRKSDVMQELNKALIASEGTWEKPRIAHMIQLIQESRLERVPDLFDEVLSGL